MGMEQTTEKTEHILIIEVRGYSSIFHRPWMVVICAIFGVAMGR